MKKTLGVNCRLTVARALCAAGMLMAFSAPSATMTLVSSNAVWRYLVTPTDPGTAWRAREFNDLGWPSGPAQLGFGEGDEATILTGMSGMTNGIVTAYFRKSFVVANANAVTNLDLRLLRDDGAVVYLNGAEVRRDNLPAGDINHFTLAISSVGGADESTFFSTTIPPSSLVSGTNVVAVAVHQNSVMSSDLSFALELVAMTGATTNQPPVTNYPPVVRLVSPTNGATFTAPTTLLLAATAYDPGTNGRVLWLEFYKGTNRLGTVSNMDSGVLGTNFYFEWMNAPTGTHLLTVKARDNQGAVSTSPPVTISVRPPEPSLLLGYLRWEVYTNVPGMVLSDLTTHPSFPDHPAFSSLLSQFETPVHIDDNFGARISGFVLPPVTGDYVFYISSDDQGALFLSSDENPANKVQIAWEPAWSDVRQWVGTVSGRTNNENISQPIPLEAGRRYYIEALHKEAGGGDHLGVAWQMPGELPPEVGAPPIPGAYLATLGGVPTNQLPTITIVASDSEAQEPYVDPVSGAVFAGDGAGFTLTRSGDLGPAVAVRLAFSGTASNGLDLAAIPNSIVMPVGVGSTWISFMPTQDSLVEGDESLVLTILPHAAYQTGLPSQAAVTIHDGVMTPTNITRELHVVSFYSGTGSDGGPSHANEQGQAAVIVNRPGKHVTLFLSSYEPVLWNVTAQPGTIIDRVILGGFYPQAVVGIGPQIAVECAYPGGNCYPTLWAGYAVDSIEFYRAVPRLHALSGLEIASFHGGYQVPYQTAVVIDGVQIDPRLRSDYPQPVPPGQLPALSFTLPFYPETFAAGGLGVFHRGYTLAGPTTGDRLLPGMSVVADAGVSNYFGVQWHSVLKINHASGMAETMSLPPSLPALSWPMGVTFDYSRNRLLLASLGGEGFLYAYSPPQNAWSLLASMNNLDVDCLVYEPTDDRLYAVEISRGHEGQIRIIRMTPNGSVVGEIALPQMSFAVGVSGYRSELAAVNGYLVLMLEPPTSGVGSSGVNESRMYLINPRTSEVRLAYRLIHDAPSARITWMLPAPIIYGTPLSDLQLNAESTIPGTMAYDPPEGTLLSAGTHTLTAVFTPGVFPGPLPTSGSVTATVSLVVMPAALTVTAENKAKYAGEPNPPLTASYAGFVTGDDANNLDAPVSLTTTATIDSKPGTYVISASGASDANYLIAHVNGALTVLPTPVPHPGGLDPSFHFALTDTTEVLASVWDQPGRLVIGGIFATINGTPQNHVARILTEGAVRVDETFNADAALQSWVRTLAMQPDGKVLVGCDVVGGVSFTNFCVARLNSDGSLDSAFHPPFSPGSYAPAIAVEPNGRIIIGGSLGWQGNTPKFQVLRLLSTGGIGDTSFAAQLNGVPSAVLPTPDGKLLIGGDFTSVNGLPQPRVARLNSDGTVDSTFNPGMGTDGPVFCLAQQPDGRILIGGGFSQVNGIASGSVARLNANGSVDTSFHASVPPFAEINALILQPDGKLVVGGEADLVGTDTFPQGVARLNPDGSTDATFDPGTGIGGDEREIYTMALQPDGRMILGGQFESYDGYLHGGLIRIFGASGQPPFITRQPTNQTRTIGQTAVFSVSVTGAPPISLQWWFRGSPRAGATNASLVVSNVQSGDAGSYFVIAANAFGSVTSVVATLTVSGSPFGPGSLDPSFAAEFVENSVVRALARQPDGRLLILGWLNGFSSRQGMARLHRDGSSDPSFSATFNDADLFSVVLQPDGRILVAGTFSEVNGVERYGVVRLHPDGSLDTTFQLGGPDNQWAATRSIVLQPDGKIIIGGLGEFGDHNVLMRLDPDGSVDESFNAGEVIIWEGDEYVVFNMALQPDGKVLVQGDISQIQGHNVVGFFRLNSDGSLDQTFRPAWQTEAVTYGGITSLLLQPDGRIVVGGWIHFPDGTTKPLVRLLPNGSLDSSFAPAVEGLGGSYALARQVDGKIIVGGSYFGVPTVPPVRLHPDGSRDSTFNVGSGVEGDILRILIEPEGGILVGGHFDRYNGVPCNGLVRIFSGSGQPPVIMRQPLSLSRSIGQTAMFSVVATGAPPLRIQWRFNSSPLSGATNVGLLLSNVQPHHVGGYDVVVANPFGSVTSTVATLTVTSFPLAIPRITAFSPRTAPTGTLVAIVGTNFASTPALNTVYFGAVKASVLGGSANTLTAIVPPGATYAPISVTVNGRTGWSRERFNPTFAGTGFMDASAFVPMEEDLATGDGPVHIAVADFDGDGKPDMAVANRFEHTLSVYRSISVPGVITPQSFAPRFQMPTDLNPTELAAADLDGDGRLDLITVNADADTVSVFRNLASPGGLSAASFAPRLDVATGRQPIAIAIGDVDGDGRPDVATANHGDNTFSVLRNLSSSGILASNSFAPRLNFAAGAGPHSIALGDLNNDGRLDAVVGNFGAGTVSVFASVPPPILTPFSFGQRVDFPAGGRTVAIGDVDGDGGPDILSGSWNGNTISLLRKNIAISSTIISSNSFFPAVTLNTGGFTHNVALGDLDGDGKPDLAAVTEMESQLLLYHNGATPGSLTASNFSPRADLATGWNAVGVTLADFDLDGRLDVAFANHYDDTVRIYRNATRMTNEQPTVVALLNVDCGANIRESEKHGFAAVGLTSSDFWNFFTRDADDSHNNWRTFGVLSNLLYANRAPSGVILTVSNAPGAWGIEVTDPMYRDYLYPFDGGNITLTVDRLPPGDYQFLFYGHGRADNANSVYEVLVDGVSLGTRATVLGPGWNSPAWQDGVQYAAFRNVRIASSNQHVTIVVHPGADGYAVLAGLQIAATRFDQVVPMSFVERDLTSPLYLPGGSTYEVMLYAHPQPGVRAFAVEDHPPTGWIVSAISDGGMFDPATGKVKFGPFFDGIWRTLSYEVSPVPGATNAQCFTGSGSADGVDSPIMGALCMVEARPHPADTQVPRWGLSIAELTAYGSAWRRGAVWPEMPNPIPIDYVTRAAFLWRSGESYRVDPEATNPPLWWVSCYASNAPAGVVPASAPLVSVSTVTRNLPGAFTSRAPLPVALDVVPGPNVGAFAVEEHLPPGWTAQNISGGGEFDGASGTVRWGPFFGGAPQNLAYVAVPPASAPATAVFRGSASFDGVSLATAGVLETHAAGRLDLSRTSTGCAGCLLLSGLPGQRFVIEASVDLQTWVPLSVVTIGDATTEFTDPAAGEFSQRFYRARPAP